MVALATVGIRSRPISRSRASPSSIRLSSAKSSGKYFDYLSIESRSVSRYGPPRLGCFLIPVERLQSRNSSQLPSRRLSFSSTGAIRQRETKNTEIESGGISPRLQFPALEARLNGFRANLERNDVSPTRPLPPLTVNENNYRIQNAGTVIAIIEIIKTVGASPARPKTRLGFAPETDTHDTGIIFAAIIARRKSHNSAKLSVSLPQKCARELSRSGGRAILAYRRR